MMLLFGVISSVAKRRVVFGMLLLSLFVPILL
jgi:hypothetical protein